MSRLVEDLEVYFGGGLNILGASGNSDTGFDLFGGLETRYGRTHPYVEGRGLFHDGSSLQLLFGLNVTLYGSHFVEHQVGAQHAAPLLPTSQTSHKIV